MIYYLLLLLFFNRNLLYFIDLRYVNDLLYMNDLLYINDSKNTSNNNNNYLFDDNVKKIIQWVFISLTTDKWIIGILKCNINIYSNIIFTFSSNNSPLIVLKFINESAIIVNWSILFSIIAIIVVKDTLIISSISLSILFLLRSDNLL